jgi:uncharacterized protein
MGEVSNYPNGHFCWIDLGTTDVPGAKAFYGGLLGWEFNDVPGGDSATYSLCLLDGKNVAGMHVHSEEEGSSWTSYISVDDVEAVAAEARVLGGSIVVEPMEIPGSAHIKVIKDPTRALVALWQPHGYPGAQLVNEVGAWGWNELVTPDVDAAKAFYTQMFGWEAADIPGVIPRTSFSLGDYLIGGAHAPQPAEGDDARWTISFLIADADGSAAQVQEFGGRVLLPPMDVPTGKFAIVSDPAGAAFLINAVPAGAFRGLDGS